MCIWKVSVNMSDKLPLILALEEDKKSSKSLQGGLLLSWGTVERGFAGVYPFEDFQDKQGPKMENICSGGFIVESSRGQGPYPSPIHNSLYMHYFPGNELKPLSEM